jgi:hypothetical protein
MGALGEQIRGHHRPPAAAACGVQKAPDKAERLDEAGIPVPLPVADRPPEQIEADPDQIGEHEGARRRRRDLGQHISAEHAADDPGYDDAAEQPPVHVAVDGVADPRGAGGEHLYRVDARRGDGRVDAAADQQGRGDHTERHAERPVDQLRGESDQDEGPDLGEVQLGQTGLPAESEGESVLHRDAPGRCKYPLAAPGSTQA